MNNLIIANSEKLINDLVYDTIERYISSDTLQGADFSSSARFRSLVGHDFSGKDLTKANFSGTVLLMRTLNDCDLDGAVFRNTSAVLGLDPSLRRHYPSSHEDILTKKNFNLYFQGYQGVPLFR